jgi:hypothetical protein
MDLIVCRDLGLPYTDDDALDIVLPSGIEDVQRPIDVHRAYDAGRSSTSHRKRAVVRLRGDSWARRSYIEGVAYVAHQ